MSALHDAAYTGEIEDVKSLLESRPNVNEQHEDHGGTPCFWLP